MGSYLFGGTWVDDGEYSTFTADGYLTGKFNFLNREHQLIFGADYSDSKSFLTYDDSSAGSIDISDWYNLDPDELMPSNSRIAGTWLEDTRVKEYGVYSNIKLELLPKLHLYLGGRYAYYEAGNASGDPSSSTPLSWATTNDDWNFVPYLAVTYALSPNWTTFVTYAESYEDQSTYYDANYNSLDPTSGKSYEWGVKGDIFNGRLQPSLTLYYTKRDNTAVQTSTDSTFEVSGRSCCYSGDGEFTSQGIEIELTGHLSKNWQINAGYTYDDNETSYGANDGVRYASYTPEHMFKLWTRYQIDKFAIGGGVTAQSSFFKSGTVNTWNPTGGTNGTGAFDGPTVPYEFTQAGRSIWNAFAEYQINRNWSAALNINNLFDKKYLTAVGTTSSGNIYGTPQEFILTLHGKY